jgi:hypothetical protein
MTASRFAAAEPTALSAEAGSSNRNTLHYTARAGLLSELSRQTYDSLYKALRESILNGIDAGAERVDLDLGDRVDRDEISLTDDGEGMDLAALRSAFMSLGGSAKYEDDRKFGRIGIGSLALLTYGSEAVIETKRTGMESVVVASLYHPQSLDRQQRSQALHDFPAGIAEEAPYKGPRKDHFTRIRLKGLAPEVQTVQGDLGAFYELIDQLRRVLPLPIGASRLFDALYASQPDLVELLRDQADQWSVPVTVASVFQSPMELKRRTYGDNPEETWSGSLLPLLKTLRVTQDGRSRKIIAAGYLASQRKASPGWSGLTARVQNVAVEERTFFDVEADPGFRKYITGEVFILGDVDTDRLININRTSFNRECRDYGVIQRFVASQLETFKRRQVADTQRQKVKLRKEVERFRGALRAIDDVARRAEKVMEEVDGRGIPSSRNGSLSTFAEIDPKRYFKTLGAKVSVSRKDLPPNGYRLEMPENSDHLRLEIASALAEPTTTACGQKYRLSFRRGPATGPPVIIKNRPREVVFNLGHPAVGSENFVGESAAMALALEIAYVLPRVDHAEALYEQVLAFLAGT